MAEDTDLGAHPVVLFAEATSLARATGADPVGAGAHLQASVARIAEAARGAGGREVAVGAAQVQARFDGARDAVAAAARALEALAHLDEDRPAAARLHFRVGLDTETGGGTQIASALAHLAPRGGLCISARAWEPSLESVVPGLLSIGEHVLDAEAPPMGVYRWDPLGLADLPVTAAPRWLAWLVLVALLASGGCTTWLVLSAGEAGPPGVDAAP